MPCDPPPVHHRRALIAGAAALAAGLGHASADPPSDGGGPQGRWYEAAAQMRRLALSWGDQAYGAVLVLDGSVVGQGPSRVVRNQDPDAHAEREAIKDAQLRLGRPLITGAVLYSTSRPCSLCESAAARAGVARMYFGPALTDAGAPHRPGWSGQR